MVEIFYKIKRQKKKQIHNLLLIQELRFLLLENNSSIYLREKINIESYFGQIYAPMDKK
jgi:hypothetical protein